MQGGSSRRDAQSLPEHKTGITSHLTHRSGEQPRTEEKDNEHQGEHAHHHDARLPSSAARARIRGRGRRLGMPQGRRGGVICRFCRGWFICCCSQASRRRMLSRHSNRSRCVGTSGHIGVADRVHRDQAHQDAEQNQPAEQQGTPPATADGSSPCSWTDDPHKLNGTDGT